MNFYTAVRKFDYQGYLGNREFIVRMWPAMYMYNYMRAQKSILNYILLQQPAFHAAFSALTNSRSTTGYISHKDTIRNTSVFSYMIILLAITEILTCFDVVQLLYLFILDNREILSALRFCSNCSTWIKTLFPDVKIKLWFWSSFSMS